MATRFYFSNGTAADLSPTISAEWEHSNGVRWAMSKIPGSTALATTPYTPDAADHTVDQDALVIQFVGKDGLKAQTIAAQAISWAFQCLEANAGNNVFLTLKIFLINSAGTVGATLLAIRRDGTEMGTSIINRTDSATSTSQSCGDGDRIVVEIGCGGLPVATSQVQGHNCSIRFGESAAGGDLPANDTSTGTTLRPWLEFANNLKFLLDADGSSAGVGVASGVGAELNTTAGSIAASATAPAASATVIAADGSSAGQATVTGTGATVQSSDGSSTGIGAAPGVSGAIKGADGSAPGISTAAGQDAAVQASAGDSTGAALDTGVSATLKTADGSSVGQASMTGQGEDAGGGATIVEADGTSVGSAEVLGDSQTVQRVAAEGASAGQAVLDGESAAIWAAFGESVGGGTVLGESPAGAGGDPVWTGRLTGVSGSAATCAIVLGRLSTATAVRAVGVPTMGDLLGVL